jgi:multiple sugar transport system substrate-binding protein
MRKSLVAMAVLAWGTALSTPAISQTELTMWSHWADHDTKVAFVEEAIKRFEDKHPGVTVKITWYQKNPLYAALKGALQAGQGPDIFYAEPSQAEYIENNLLLPLDDKLNWENIEDFARGAWTFDGKAYALPLEAATVEVYYSKQKMRELGIELPPNAQFDAAGFADVVKTAKAAGITPIVAGVGDRGFPGAYLAHEMILKKIGSEDYQRLLDGELSWQDERVMEVLEYIEGLVKAGAYPTSFATLKLGESHGYFHTNPGGLIFPMGSWYTSRAFLPVDQGGQPEDFDLGIMRAPVPDNAACPDCKTLAIGGSYVINARTEQPDLAAALLNEMATVEMGNLWLASTQVGTGIKTDPSKIDSEFQSYFEDLAEVNEGAEYFIGIPQDHLIGACSETFQQVINAGFPAGHVGAQQAAQMMDQVCLKK